MFRFRCAAPTNQFRFMYIQHRPISVWTTDDLPSRPPAAAPFRSTVYIFWLNSKSILASAISESFDSKRFSHSTALYVGNDWLIQDFGILKWNLVGRKSRKKWKWQKISSYIKSAQSVRKEKKKKTRMIKSLFSFSKSKLKTVRNTLLIWTENYWPVRLTKNASFRKHSQSSIKYITTAHTHTFQLQYLLFKYIWGMLYALNKLGSKDWPNVFMCFFVRLCSFL